MRGAWSVLYTLSETLENAVGVLARDEHVASRAVEPLAIFCASGCVAGAR